MDAIFTRRSIRKYETRDLDEDTIRKLLKAGMSAPSAVNERPWHFVVIRQTEVKDLIPDIHPHALMVREAPLVIAVCADLDLEISQGYWVQDCAAATENILLEAHSLGLGAVWLGVHPREDRVRGLGKLLELPATVRVFSLIPVGYPAEDKEVHDRYEESRVHWKDKW